MAACVAVISLLTRDTTFSWLPGSWTSSFDKGYSSQLSDWVPQRYAYISLHKHTFISYICNYGYECVCYSTFNQYFLVVHFTMLYQWQDYIVSMIGLKVNDCDERMMTNIHVISRIRIHSLSVQATKAYVSDHWTVWLASIN